jgi:hypothetical protein
VEKKNNMAGSTDNSPEQHARPLMEDHSEHVDATLIVSRAGDSKADDTETLGERRPHLDSLEFAFMENLRGLRRRRVRFSMEFGSVEKSEGGEPNDEGLPHPKRRRLQRRNSKTAAMLLPASSPASNAFFPSPIYTSQLCACLQMRDSEEHLAKSLFEMIERDRKDKERSSP